MTDDWSQAEDQKLLRMWLADEPPRSTREIADDLERSKSAVGRRIATLGARGRKGDRALYEQLMGVSLEPLIRPVRVDTPAFPTGEVLPSSHTTLVWGDVHFPFQSDAAVDILYQVARDLKPDRLVCIGDVFDFFELSPEYRSPRDVEPDMQETLNLGTAHLAHMVDLAEPSDAYFLGGNHEDRWDRLLEKARKDIRFRQLLKLSKIRRSLDFEEVVGFAELGYDYRPYVEARPLIEHDRLVYTHGERTNKYAARSMLDRYGRSLIFGHTHRIQNFTRRDLKGQESAWNIGCLSILNPHYDHFADWSQGFAVVEWTQSDGDWYFNVEQIRIHHGVALWRDKVYRAGSA